jgi:hypothetical protein
MYVYTRCDTCIYELKYCVHGILSMSILLFGRSRVWFGRRLMTCQFPIRLPTACLSIHGRLQPGTRLVPTRATTPLAVMICQQR